MHYFYDESGECGGQGGKKNKTKVQRCSVSGGDVLGDCLASQFLILVELFVLSGGCWKEMKEKSNCHVSNNFFSRSLSLSLCLCLSILFAGVKRSYTFGPAGGGYEDPVQ